MNMKKTNCLTPDIRLIFKRLQINVTWLRTVRSLLSICTLPAFQTAAHGRQTAPVVRDTPQLPPWPHPMQGCLGGEGGTRSQDQWLPMAVLDCTSEDKSDDSCGFKMQLHGVRTGGTLAAAARHLQHRIERNPGQVSDNRTTVGSGVFCREKS